MLKQPFSGIFIRASSIEDKQQTANFTIVVTVRNAVIRNNNRIASKQKSTENNLCFCDVISEAFSNWIGKWKQKLRRNQMRQTQSYAIRLTTVCSEIVLLWHGYTGNGTFWLSITSLLLKRTHITWQSLVECKIRNNKYDFASCVVCVDVDDCSMFNVHALGSHTTSC